MLSHKLLTRKDIGKVSKYYQDAADDYYAKELDATTWQGKGAEELGLIGPICPKRFKELLAGIINPTTQIGKDSIRHDSKNRLGIDLTFSAPKSVSLQALINGDIEILKAHEEAVTATIKIAEMRAQTRKKVNGKSYIENTSNLVIAKFRHETSRALDPQLHTHAIILNMTKRKDGAWRALKNDGIIKHTRFLGAIYNSELAERLQKLGFALRFERDGKFELAHITREQIEAFSKRTKEVEEHLQAQGLNRQTATSCQKEKATLLSRKKKIAMDRLTLHTDWLKEAEELEVSFKKISHHFKDAKKATSALSEEGALQSLKYAIDHLTERQSIIYEKDLIAYALQHCVGKAKWLDIQNAVTKKIAKGELIKEAPLYYPSEEKDATTLFTRQQWIEDLVKKGKPLNQARKEINAAILEGRLIQGEIRFTTPHALKLEKNILKLEKDGRKSLKPILTPKEVAEKLQLSNLNKGQKEAASLILTTTNHIVGVQGFAGTGKSHMLKKTKEIIEAQGFKVHALAPYGSQVKALDVFNVKAHTLASFLQAPKKDINEKTVLVIDEAGVIPTKSMEKVLTLAAKANCHVVLLGDTAQTKAIEAGSPFHQLQKEGMQTALMDEIQRQKNVELKKAVELAAYDKSALALKHIPQIFEVSDENTRRATIAKDYVQLSADDRARTIIVTGTNEARREINKNIRMGLHLEGVGESYTTLNRRDMTKAERTLAKNYQIGDVIQPEKNYSRCALKQGLLYRVEDTAKGNKLVVRSMDNQEIIEFNPMTYRKLSVYKHNKKELTIGDMIRITRNDKDLNLVTGDRFKVSSVTQNEITIANESRKITLDAKKYLHLDYAYATTVHSSQGLTADRVLIDAETKSRTTAKDVFYVAISRARLETKIYTNDKENLPLAIERENRKFTALEMAQ